MDDNDDLDLSSLMFKNDFDKPDPKSNKSSVKSIEKTEIHNEKLEKLLEQKLTNPKKEKKDDKKEKPTEDDIINKRRLILLLQFYLLEFPDKLKSFKKINLEKKTLDELKDLQKEFDFCIGNQSNIKGGTALVLSGIQALEYVSVNFTPLQCNGLAEAIKNDPESIDTIKHICLKHMASSMFNTEPEHRLLYKVMTTALSLHTVNSFTTQMTNHNDDIINKVNSEYSDL